MERRKEELFSIVPQDISRHFIEHSNHAEQQQQQQQHHHQTAAITIDQTCFDSNQTYDGSTFYEYDDYDYSEDDDNDDDGEQDEAPKWSFVRGLFSKLHLSTNQPQPQKDASPNLSTYGSLIHNRRIGEGVSAIVQLTQKQDDIFAVKIFRKRNRKENMASYMKALAGEFCIASSLNHENIIKTLDFVRMDEDPQRYCIVMEYCPEGDMYSLIKEYKLQDQDIYSYFKQLLQGLDYMHSLGVAHRDLKPENLLIHQGTLKIADFGSADVFRVAYQDHSRLSDGLCGTTPYMAPEIFLEQGYWAAPVDVWAAGIILFCMKFDGVPFGSATSNDANYPIYLQKRLLRKYDPFNKLDFGSRTLIYAMLNPDSDRRIAVQDILKIPWIQDIQ